ncbi:branched-chain amino acid transport system ATP-binding protein [Rhizobium petrolearium]|uniref:ABC transporter ATP-binding protein n=2 Tax=Neorhizobium TaxID=1525371 RepID=A0ABV0ME28_9HYPH|nr:ABC transporter ATP-binding protein [Neorhizobium petrolearium]MBP1848415.1 branched-chain amino acid transport system ATP-binding protein [Neorhizobium petrolearium]MCC2614474.1 ABC transporter ATP-binding protein [Neorhizobium petrolearium]WGI72237.1 ABC transporter ATP-binding protein [Neorhizobium petrolearium]
MSLLELQNVHAAYGSARVLHGVSLKVEKGERVALIGRNGVGKTTVVNTCIGAARLTSGKVSFMTRVQKPIRAFRAARSGISIVPQGRRIVPGLTVRENLLLGSAPDRKGPWNLEAVFAMYPILRERADGLGTAMSGGQQQMLAIGRALMANPDLLILDEPSEGLAPVVVDELGASLVRLAEQGTAILLIEQNFGLIRSVGDRYYVMAKGSVVEDGRLSALTAEELKRHVSV